MPPVPVVNQPPTALTFRRDPRPQSLGFCRAAPSPLQRLVGNSPVMQKLRARVESVGPRDVRVLIVGPSGSGKELVARAIHELSSRHAGPLVNVNCAALPRELVESELFGYERGAFTGATSRRRGFFELADGGTILLDEISELAPEAQAKLLRVLEDLRFRRVGGEEEVQVDVRVLAASNQDLAHRVACGRFREDLFHRLNVVTVEVPSLNDHPADLPDLVKHFLAHFGALETRFTAVAIDQLRRHPWPGNVRELRNTIQRTLAFAPGREITTVDLTPSVNHEPATPPPNVAAAVAGLSTALASSIRSGHTPRGLLPAIERTLAETALTLAEGNKTVAARWLEWDRKALTRRLRRRPSSSPG